ncbi:MAG: response regulator, partial [Bacteroidia bacterium]
MHLKCAIIDDDPFFTKVLELYLTKVENITCTGTYLTPFDALNKINFKEIDFLFLDIEMPDMNGIEFLKSLTTFPPTV